MNREICLYKVEKSPFLRRLRPFFWRIPLYFAVVTFVIVLMYVTGYTKEFRWDAYIFFLIVTVIRGIGSVRVTKKYLYKVCFQMDFLVLKYAVFDNQEELKIPLKYCSLNLVEINTVTDVYELRFLLDDKVVFRQQNISDWSKPKMKEVKEKVEKLKRYVTQANFK